MLMITIMIGIMSFVVAYSMVYSKIVSICKYSRDKICNYRAVSAVFAVLISFIVMEVSDAILYGSEELIKHFIQGVIV